MAAEKPDQLVQSLDRALDILEKIVYADKAIGITELSNSLGLHKSTVYRLLATLAYRGYVQQDYENPRYKVGIKLLEIGNIALDRLEIRKEIRPLLEELMTLSGETVHLGILDKGEVVYIDKVESPQTIRMYSSIGKRAPVHCTGLGKALIAFLPPAEINNIIQQKGLKGYTSNTITDKEEFLKHLYEIRLKGYSMDNIEHEEGIRCVAGPIFDHRGEVVAAVSIASPVMRVTEEKVQEYIKLIKEYTKRMSSVLGYTGL